MAHVEARDTELACRLLQALPVSTRNRQDLNLRHLRPALDQKPAVSAIADQANTNGRCLALHAPDPPSCAL